MSDAFAVRIPHEFVNDDTVKLLRWMVEDGQEVREGQTLAEIETSKAVVELAAGATGKISQKRKPGEELRVGEIVGFISGNGISSASFESAVEAATPRGTPAQHATESEKPPADTRFSKKALDLLQANALSPSLFSGRGLVRETDVIEHLKKVQEIGGRAAVTHSALDGISLDRVTLPARFSNCERGKIDPDFYRQLRKDPDSFAGLSSDEKCETYRKHGAVVGEGVLLGAGSVVVAPQIEIGSRLQIGSNSSIQCRERFAAGQLTSFRSGLSIRGGTVVLGENIFGGGNVQIGGGGNGDPYAVLGLGDGTYVGDDVFINICRPVLIGREVFLTQRSILVTHNIGHSVLEGYENRFAPIVLEDYAQVGMNSTIYAGSRIGRGSIVMSNSYVVSSIPPDKLAAGVPARVIREAKRPIDAKRQIEMVREMMGEYHELLTLKGHSVSSFEREPFPAFDVQRDDKRFRLSFIATLAEESFQPEPADESIIWTLKDSGRKIPGASSVMDLVAKRLSGEGGVFVETTREFLRKRGIRLEPGPWRYSGGLI